MGDVMIVHDISEDQNLADIDFASADGWIIRAGTGQYNLREDYIWRGAFNECVKAGKPLGLYWFAGGSPSMEASFFHGLVGFLSPEQVRLGFWLDAETGQDAGYVTQFRAACQLPFCGLYGSLNNFNTDYPQYLHFGMNWLAMPTGTVVPSGWEVPDHIMVQTGIVNGLDANEVLSALPYPPQWT
jgi:hypothetical protein